MRFINQFTEILPYYNSVNEAELMKHIELCGRVCYKSEDKITEGSAKKLISAIIKSGHHSVLEHGTIGISLPFRDDRDFFLRFIQEVEKSPYLFIENPFGTDIRIYGNVRAWRNFFLEHCNSPYPLFVFKFVFQKFKEQYPNLFSDLAIDASAIETDSSTVKFISAAHYRLVIRWVTNRGISHELVRHRVFSFSQESTRYCNYSASKFKKQMTYIKRTYLRDAVAPSLANQVFYTIALKVCEWVYNILIKAGFKPQEARGVLPNDLKTEVIMTGTVKQWGAFFELRTKPDVHPQLLELSLPLYTSLKTGIAYPGDQV